MSYLYTSNTKFPATSCTWQQDCHRSDQYEHWRVAPGRRNRLLQQNDIRCKSVSSRSQCHIWYTVARAASEEVVLHLVKSKCYPVLLYGLEACTLNKDDLRSLNFTATQFVMKLSRTSYSLVIADCQTFSKLNLQVCVWRYQHVNLLHDIKVAVIICVNCFRN